MRNTASILLLVAGAMFSPAKIDAQLLDLGTLGGARSAGYHLNEAGQVAGWSETASGEQRAFLYSGGVMTDLGTLISIPGGTIVTHDMNDHGQVVGQATAPFGSGAYRPHAFLYSDGAMIDLGTLGGEQSIARAVNDAGHVVGEAQTADGGTHAFLYRDGLMIDLTALTGFFSGVASAINDSGQVVVNAATADGIGRTFLYSAGVMTDLGTLGGDRIEGLAINGVGQVAGWSQIIPGDFFSSWHAFLYSDGVMIDLGTLGGTNSRAVAINEAGQVVGNAETAEGVSHAFLYSGGVMTDLGTLGGTTSNAFAINNAGQVVGWARAPGNPATSARPFVYSGGVMTDLGTLPGADEGSAEAINDAGQFTGTSSKDGGISHAILGRWGEITTLEPESINGSVGGAILTLTTDDEEGGNGATLDDPFETTVAAPAGTLHGTVSITEHPRAPADAPGFLALGTLVTVMAANILPPATPDAPLVLGFRMEASSLPPGQDETTIVVSRDGVAVPSCAGSPGRASPDPCVSLRERFADGDVGLTILTSSLSAWSFAGEVCGDVPIGGCQPAFASKAKLVVKERGHKDVVVWEWKNAETIPVSSFGRPHQASHLTLCGYDAAGRILRLRIPAGGTCAGKACWGLKKTGFKYKDGERTPDGVTNMALQSGEPRRAKISVKASGVLALPSLPVAPPVVVQLRSVEGPCFEALFSTFAANGPAMFRATSD